jgi:hypothetical protein
LVTLVALKYSIFDEIRLQGHLAIIESILRGKFPPAYTAFPDIPYRYHYGVNLIAALFSKAFSLPGYLGLDVATLFLWFSLTAALIYFFNLIGIPRKALGLGFLFVTFSGGLCWLLTQHAQTPGQIYQLPQWQQLFIYWRAVHPNFIMYFFQHPMGLGVVLFLGSLIFFQEWLENQRFGTLILGSLVLGALSLAQVMLFATLLAALGLLFFIRLFLPNISFTKNLWSGLVVLVIALGLAAAMGGFFQFSANLENQPLLFSWPPGYLRHEFYGDRHPITWQESFIWYLGGFGFFLFLVPLALYKTFRKHAQICWLLALFAVICFLVPQFFRYQYSWDIVKWFFGFELAGRLLVAWIYLPWVSRKIWLSILAWIFVLFGMITPFRLMTELSFKEPSKFNHPELRIASYRQPKLQGIMVPLINEMKKCPDCYGMVWSSSDTSVGLAILTGYPMLQIDQNTLAMPVGRERIAERQAVLKTLGTSPDISQLRAQKIRWIIFNCNEFKQLTPDLQSFIKSLQQTPMVRDHSVNENGACVLALELPWK